MSDKVSTSFVFFLFVVVRFLVRLVLRVVFESCCVITVFSITLP